MQKTIAPIVKWAQRKDKVFVTVDVQDLKDEKVELTAGSIKFSAKDEGQLYAFTFNFFGEINVEESKWNNYTLNIRFILVKKENGYWSRLTKESGKTQWIQVDWPRYVDEDDEEEEGQKGLEDWDQNQFQNIGQQGGDQNDEDDEEPEENNDLDNQEEIGQDNKEVEVPEQKAQ